MRTAIVSLAVLAFAVSGHASVCEQVVDADHEAGFLNGRELGGELLYGGKKSGTGTGVWKSDGVTSSLVEVIEASPPGSNAAPILNLEDSVLHGGVLYFAAEDNTNGCELWETDGSALGTGLHSNISPGVSGSLLGWLPGCRLGDAVSIGTGFILGADDGTNGQEPYFCDGLGSCTLIRDVHSGGNDSLGPGSGSTFNHSWFTKLSASEVLFNATDGVSGRELWKTDGTLLGTSLACDINSGSAHSGIARPVVFGGDAYFAADDGVNGCELWKYESGVGCSLVKDIRPGSSGGLGANFGEGCQDWDAVVAGSMLYFRGNDGSSGVELWKSDGTGVGTVLVKDINPTGDSTQGAEWCGDTFSTEELDGEVFFFATDGVNGCEPWRSDGTVGGTVMIEDLNPGSGGSVDVTLDLGTKVQGTPSSFVFVTQRDTDTDRHLSQCSLSGCVPDLLCANSSLSLDVMADSDVGGSVFLMETDGSLTDVIVVPEPSVSLMLLAGAGCIAILRSLRRDHR